MSAGRPLRVLHVGRLVPQKAQCTLIGAVAVLARRGVPVELVILGEGPLLGELAAQAAAEGIEDRVDLAGVVHDVRPALEACDVFAFPSLWEGQGNALLEAMAVGRPVVTTDLAVFREVTGDDGVLCPPADIRGLADALEDVAGWSAERRGEVGTALRRRVEERYAAPAKVGALADHYRHLLGRPST